jgi:hypothetical protein
MVPRDRASLTSDRTRGNASSKSAAAPDLRAFRQEVSYDLAYSIAPFRHPWIPLAVAKVLLETREIYAALVGG